MSIQQKMNQNRETLGFADFSNNNHAYNLVIVNNCPDQDNIHKTKRTTIEEMKLSLFFADNADLRKQYYDLRQKCFTEVDEEYRARCPEECSDWHDYDGSETEDDRRGKILVAVDDKGTVVAGARFLLSTSILFTANEEPWNNFTIRKFLEEKGYDPEAKYCEIDDIVVDKKFRNRLLIKNMFKFMIEQAEDSYCDYILGIAIESASRTHKMLFTSLKYKLEIHKDYPWIKQKNHGYETRYPIICKLY